MRFNGKSDISIVLSFHPLAVPASVLFRAKVGFCFPSHKVGVQPGQNQIKLIRVATENHVNNS